MKNDGYRYITYHQVFQLLGFFVFIFFIWYFYHKGLFNPDIIKKYNTHYPITSVGLFIITYAVLVIASIPTLPLNLAAGFFWGSVLGGIYATLGVTIGGWVSFNLARSIIGKKLTGKFDNKLISNVQHEFDQNGWKFVAVARLTPIIPTGPLNYLLGLTSISNITFLWATLFFLPPVTITIAFIGNTLGSFNAQESGISETIGIIIVVSAAVTFLLAIKFISKLIKKS